MENLFSQEKAKALPQNLQKLLLQGKKAEALRFDETTSTKIITLINTINHTAEVA